MYNLVITIIAIIGSVSVIALIMYMIRCMMIKLLKSIISKGNDAYLRGNRSKFTRCLITSAILSEILYRERPLYKRTQHLRSDSMETGYFPYRHR